MTFPSQIASYQVHSGVCAFTPRGRRLLGQGPFVQTCPGVCPLRVCVLCAVEECYDCVKSGQPEPTGSEVRQCGPAPKRPGAGPHFAGRLFTTSGRVGNNRPLAAAKESVACSNTERRSSRQEQGADNRKSATGPPRPDGRDGGYPGGLGLDRQDCRNRSPIL